MPVKTALGRAIAAVSLVALAPLLVVLAAAVKLTSSGPVLYRQRRVGLHGRVFEILKFRSMRVPTSTEHGFRPPPGRAPGGVEGEDRRTPLGREMRRWGLDELPQLVNVLRGEMSLVGPRPERPEFVETFHRQIVGYRDRHQMKPGMTGWAQVNGLRGQTSVRARVARDTWYIQNWSLWLDIRILIRTPRAVAGGVDDTDATSS